MRLLIIDDDPALCETVCEYWKARGAGDAVCATSASKGIRQIIQQEFDIVLLDVLLDPPNTATDVLRRAGYRLRHTKVFLITGFPDLPELEEIEQVFPVEHLLIKPLREEHYDIITGKTQDYTKVILDPHSKLWRSA